MMKSKESEVVHSRQEALSGEVDPSAQHRAARPHPVARVAGSADRPGAPRDCVTRSFGEGSETVARRLLRVRLMGMRFVAVMVASMALAFGAQSQAATPAAIEIAPPPAAYATDANALRAIAAAELGAAHGKRRVVVSLAVAKPATDEPTECAVDATLRDARTGVVIAVIDATTRMTGPLSRDERRALAHTAVRNAARRVIAAHVLDR
jgi:hypothetical protein